MLDGVFNHDEPAVADYVCDVMTHWLERGASGWRLDAAYAVPTGFWRQVADPGAHLENTRMLLRVTDGTSALLVALNLGEPGTLVLPSPPWHLVSGAGRVAGHSLRLAAHGWCVLAPGRR